jgi:hypothetical protein
MALSSGLTAAARAIKARKAELSAQLVQAGTYDSDIQPAELRGMIRGLTEAESLILAAAIGPE